MQVIDETTIKSRTGEAEALEAVDRAFRALAEGRVMQPPPMSLDVQPAGGEVHVKGACLAGSPVFAIKVASGFYGNQACDLPTGSGLVLVFDATTGFPLGVLQDNGYLTDLRTAAAGALAARLLTKENVRKVAFIGSDCIEISSRWIQAAFAQLNDKHDAVIGPTPDGGYHLLAMQRYLPTLFEEIPWSTPATCQATTARAAEEGISLYRLPPLPDIDTEEDYRSALAGPLGTRLQKTVENLGSRTKLEPAASGLTVRWSYRFTPPKRP